MLAFYKVHRLKLKLFFFSCPPTIIIFSSLIIFGISIARVVSFDGVFACSGDLQLKQTLFHFCHLYFQSFLFHQKLKHALTCDSICNRYIFMKCIIRFQISNCPAYNMLTNWVKIYMTPLCKISFQVNHN